MWANAVILEDGVTKEVGDPIIVPTADSTTTEVKAMYVWIPRYSYAIASEDEEGGFFYGKYLPDANSTWPGSDSPGAIDIKFVDVNTKETGVPQYYTWEGPAENWLTHPAFTFGEKELTGIWVGKFKMGTLDSERFMNWEYTNTEPYILPNVTMVFAKDEVPIYDAYKTSQKFTTYLSNDANVDSHMMKNSEWGALAYLSQSIYGKYGNIIYDGENKNIYITHAYWSENIMEYTGKSSGVSPSALKSNVLTCNYDDITDRGRGKGACGAGASTTGNIYGAYDMVGYSEMVMGYYVGACSEYGSNPDYYFGSNESCMSTEFRNEEMGDKYFNAYTTDDIYTACNGGICYGHALTELIYPEYFLSHEYPWIIRGELFAGANNVIFKFFTDNIEYGAGFRSVLVKE